MSGEPEVLAAQVAALKARNSRQKDQSATDPLPEDSEPAATPLGASERHACSAVQSIPLLRAARVCSAEELRAWSWRNEIIPQLQRNGVKERFWYEMKEWNQPAQKRVFQKCLALFSGPSSGAIVALVGQRGAGKTTIAAQLIIAMAWQAHSVLYAPDRPSGFFWPWTPYRKLRELLSALKSSYSDFGSISADQTERALKAYSTAPFLVIDELHDCEEQRLAPRVLTDILDNRYAMKRDTLLISNETPEKFRVSLGASAVSRMNESGEVIPCAWGSWRTEEKRPLIRTG